ncbi:MAG: 4-(cytidine 5'-diphospho)-2-C-methyl-D-erythritol kinase [Acidobacteriota bacterium]|nr:4-(cytidine 5'-diphospho)-2-C-methyl-D-erythritol kinase [Acidobacteriota bacterium]
MKHSSRIRAFAKINTGLKILGKRPDRFHELRTVYQTITLHDDLRLTLATGRGIEVRCDDPSVPNGRANLAYRACQIWKRLRQYRGGVRIEIRKSIPTGSGLGGGSSDAAATLMGLERMMGSKIDQITMFAMAAELGSDVPLFLQGGRVLGCGRGEEVYPLPDLPRRHCLVIYPRFSISTADAFRALDLRLTREARPSIIRGFGVWSQFPMQGWGPAENDFESFVFAKWPELGRLKDQLIRAGAEIASLTGSGSAIYAIFVSARQMKEAAKQTPREWVVLGAQTLSRPAYRRSLFCDD